MPEHRPVGVHGDARDALELLPGVVVVDVVAADPALGGPAIEMSVGPKYDRVPPRVLRCLAAHDLGIRRVESIGDYCVVIAV